MSLNHCPPLIDAQPLKERFIGKTLSQIDPPAAILDLALIRKNCDAMLQSAAAIGVLFRAHVKTHKTVELTRLQVGETGPVRLVASTVAEMELLLPYMLECKEKGRKVNMIYGMPTPPSTLRRLAEISSTLASPSSNGLILLVDSLAGVQGIAQYTSTANAQFDIMIKVDTGYHRSGIPVDSPVMESTLSEISALTSSSKAIRFAGFYSHRGDSYSGNTPSDALSYLQSELEGLRAAAALIATYPGLPKTRLCLSFGATPTATAIQNILSAPSPETASLRSLIDALRRDHDLEAHAGVYPVLDLQQLATHARPSAAENTVAALDTSHIALRVMVEVASVYTDRPTPQVLVAAGTLALGREPCKSYSAWGVVTPWLDVGSATYAAACAIKADDASVKRVVPVTYSEAAPTGWVVDKISQEHSILGWRGEHAEEGAVERDGDEARIKMRRMGVGEKVMVWPNHACVAGAAFGWYLVVDGGEEVVDVWVRGRGW
ncbi:hypothetical protein EJ05DRAFT_473407 [Pseudovirgaria hyperparasitica]|uniref:D-serine dehydratase n=1 Tax=Pseudovirgaria hyperparasitica TaxID=470096 RepID=A0A6A6WFL7_9PEZI|nr:uncharacterized protein EJ05DRAFT_473407 [Pseudovirgaria hyperparasitica]KAF2760800.1 hypothetical protein EJ05DRAFT_473407 [Pseudovirgaria hyperparasitica]